VAWNAASTRPARRAISSRIARHCSSPVNRANSGGFAEDAPLALVFGKEIDVLLADRSDIQIALEATRTFQEMMRAKMRAAAQRGDVYYTYQRWLDANP
jgi:hypothetical protein